MARFGGIPVDQQATKTTAGAVPSPKFGRKVGFPEPVEPDYTGGAPWTAMAKAAFVDDPEIKKQIYAESMFPGDPEAIKRFGFMEGEPVYRTKDWRLSKVEPGGLLGGLKTFSAGQPAYLPHEILGGVGATGGPLTAGLGVAGGEGIRKVVGGAIFGEPQTIGGNVQSMAASGLLGGAIPTFGAQKLSGLLNRGVVRDIANYNPEELTRISQLSKQFDIPLTVAEKTNLGSLKGYQTALGNITDSADAMAKFYGMRGEKATKAVEKALMDISPIDSPEDAAAKAVRATLGAKEKITTEMKKRAAPLYEKAYASGSVDVGDVVSGIGETASRYPQGSQIARSLNKVESLLTKKTTDAAGNVTRVPQDNFQMLDYAKREIDDLIGAAKRKGQGNIVRELTSHKNALLGRMDELSPDYKIAREIWTEGADALDKIDSTAVKVIANLPEEKYQTAATRMFNPKTTGPNAVRKAKNIIAKEDPEAWNGLVRSYVENAWDDASKFENKGYSFKRMIFGDTKKKRTLEAAMSPQQFKSFSDLMDVLDATGRVKQVGSDTAYKQEVIRELNEKWGAGWNDVARPVGAFKEFISRKRIGKNAQKMAEILTTQDGVESIKLIKQLPPGSRASMNAISTLLGIQAQAGTSPAEQIPE